MGLKPVDMGNGLFGIAIFDKQTQIGMSHAFSGRYYKTETRAQNAIDKINKKYK